MCCLWAVLVFAGARLGAIFWWLIDQPRWSVTFDNPWIPIIGVFFVPWLTISYVLVYPGGVNGFDWVILGLGLFLDIASYGGGGYSRSHQYT